LEHRAYYISAWKLRIQSLSDLRTRPPGRWVRMYKHMTFVAHCTVYACSGTQPHHTHRPPRKIYVPNLFRFVMATLSGFWRMRKPRKSANLPHLPQFSCQIVFCECHMFITWNLSIDIWHPKYCGRQNSWETCRTHCMLRVIPYLLWPFFKVGIMSDFDNLCIASDDSFVIFHHRHGSDSAERCCYRYSILCISNCVWQATITMHQMNLSKRRRF
jgi:hypothetical protein